MPGSAMAEPTTLLLSASTEIQPSLDVGGVINTFRDPITLLRLAAAKVVMQPQGIYLEPRLSGKKYLDAFAPLAELLSPTFNLYHLDAQWQTLIETIANCPDLSLACKQADDFIAQLERTRINGSFDFAARTLLAKAHRLANEGLHALEQKDHVQAKEYLQHATVLYYKLRPLNLTTKVIYNDAFVLDACVVLPDLTPDFMRLQTCLRIMGTIATQVPPKADLQ
jgi:hypothetical protein